MMEPRSKLHRLVFTPRLVEAGLTLVAEAESFATDDHARARGVRNGLMIALLAHRPIRLKNFAALEVGQTFKEIHGRWWIALPRMSTKSRRADERPVPAVLNRYIDLYLKESRPVLLGSMPPTNALWISSTTGRRMTAKNLGILVSKITLENSWRGCFTPPIPHCCGLHRSRVWRKHSPPRKCLAEPFRSAGDGGALQSCKQCECCPGIRTDDLRNSYAMTFPRIGGRSRHKTFVTLVAGGERNWDPTFSAWMRIGGISYRPTSYSSSLLILRGFPQPLFDRECGAKK